MLRVLGAALTISLFLGGCQTPQPRVVPFNEAEYAQFAKPGTGAVKGQAFIATRGGSVVKGAGREVILAPQTSYEEETYQTWAINYREVTGGDRRVLKYVKTTVADGDGNFEFSNLAAGDYILYCNIQWEWSANAAATGGVAHAKVTVKNGQTTRAIVTR